MRALTIRERMLAAALLPVFLLVLALVAFFWLGRSDDANDSHVQRGRLLLQQTVLASELGLFSGNVESLQLVVNGVQREAEVRLVAVFDASGAPLVSSRTQEIPTYEVLVSAALSAGDEERSFDTYFGPIGVGNPPVDDVYSGTSVGAGGAHDALGYAIVQMSRDGLIQRQRDMRIVAATVAFMGFLLGGFLAVKLGEGVVGPILRVSRTMERIGRGDFSARMTPLRGDPLFELQEDLNRMAVRLEWGRDELEKRVQEATHELRERKDQAEAATQAKSRFLAAASHDLRQPTHALGMFIARLGQLSLDAPTRKLVGNLQASTLAMQELLDSLLDVSRLDAGVVPVRLSSFSLQDLLNNVYAALAPTAAARGLRFRIRTTSVWVYSDAALLQRMVMNLAQNAVNYTPEGTVLLAVRPTATGSHIRLEVWDSGIGISPENQKEVFNEFYQVGNRGRDRNQGLGLGLNIVERTAQLLEISVSLRSQLGRGTRFSLRIPTGVAGASAPLASEPPATADLHGVAVLVVEDNDTARLGLSDLLEDWGCRVTSVSDTVSAIQQVQAGYVPGVVVSDYRLGEGDNGLQLIMQLRTLLGHSLKACLVSGDTDAGLFSQAQAAQIPLLHKPVRPAKLRSLLRRLVSVAPTTEDASSSA